MVRAAFYVYSKGNIRLKHTCVAVVPTEDDADDFVDVFRRSNADSSSTTTVLCDPITLLCDIGGVCNASRCPNVWNLCTLLLIELYLLLSYTGDGDGFDDTDWFDFNGGAGCAAVLFE